MIHIYGTDVIWTFPELHTPKIFLGAFLSHKSKTIIFLDFFSLHSGSANGDNSNLYWIAETVNIHNALLENANADIRYNARL